MTSFTTESDIDIWPERSLKTAAVPRRSWPNASPPLIKLLAARMNSLEKTTNNNDNNNVLLQIVIMKCDKSPNASRGQFLRVQYGIDVSTQAQISKQCLLFTTQTKSSL